MNKNELPSFGQASRVFAKIGLLSFGGPAAQIALMHKMIVEEQKWLSERQFLNALSFSMLLPGPEAMQLATYSGWRMHGLRGGLMAGGLFVIPGAIVILILAALYSYFGDVPFVNAIFLGVKAAVVIIVIEALLRVSKKALKETTHWIIAAFAFIGIFFLNLPFPLIVLGAGLYGLWFASVENSEVQESPVIQASFGTTLVQILIWLLIWWVPVLALGSILDVPILKDIGLFFSKLAVVTFGGAYAVLAYMGQDVVNSFGWLSAGEMMDGLGLAETTPGPLILVTEFVGFIAAFKEGGFWMGVFGALVALWVTFIPCFLWIFAGAPYLEWICAQPRLRGALDAITAAVVGVILNLSIWFGLQVFFKEVSLNKSGFLNLWTPNIASLDFHVLFISLVCGVLMLLLHQSIGRVLLIAGGLGILLSFA